MDDLHGSGDGLSESSTTEEMARLLLAGWTMLADTCSECRDVPLMRNNDGALKCCRCKKESRDASHRVASASSEASRSVPTGIGERHKYSIVSEYGLDSCALSGIHGVDGDRVLSTMPVVKPAAPVVATEGRRLQQLCLLRVELSKALDRLVKQCVA